MSARITTYARWAAFVNVFSSIVGFVGYTLARSQGEPFTSLGYMAFVIWALALVPIMFWFHQGTAEALAQNVTLLIGLLAVFSGVVLQCILIIRLLTLDQSTAWNFASAGAIGLWLILAHRDARFGLPRALRIVGLAAGILWLLAFLSLGWVGFPPGGPKGNFIATLGFGADAAAYFAEILWATWLRIALLRDDVNGEGRAIQPVSEKVEAV